jgi:hypothetical protein
LRSVIFHFIIAIAGLSLTACVPPEPTKLNSPVPSPEKAIEYRPHQWQSEDIQTLTIPSGSKWILTVAVADELTDIDDFARQHRAIAAINAGYFDPENQKTTSFVITNGKLTANPQTNVKLVNNPKLKPYLPKIFNRSEFRAYQCQSNFKYEIVAHKAPIPDKCQLVSTVGGGPQLLPQITATEEGFIDRLSGKIIRDPIGIDRPNARSAVGITSDGSVILVMVAQSKAGGGLSLPQLQSFLRSLGAVQAMALDGGSSSSFYYQGKTIYGKVDSMSRAIARPIKSVILVQQKSDRAAN